MTDTYTPATAARATGYSVSTIRRYGDSLSDMGLLSEGADPSNGKREYSKRDVILISHTVAQKLQGMTRDEALDMAQTVTDDDLPPDIPLQAYPEDAETPVDSVYPIQSAAVLAEPLYALLARLDTTDDIRGDIIALAERVSRIEQWIESLPSLLRRGY